MTLDRLTAVVEGRVQAVGYRYWTAQRARALRLAGTVENRPDGSVLVVAEGPRAALAALLAALHDGPAHAQVTSVSPEFGPGSGEFEGFQTR